MQHPPPEPGRPSPQNRGTGPIAEKRPLSTKLAIAGVLGGLVFIGVYSAARSRDNSKPTNKVAEAPAVPGESRKLRVNAEFVPADVQAGDGVTLNVNLTNVDEKPIDKISVHLGAEWDNMQEGFKSSSNVTHKQGPSSGPHLHLNAPIAPGATESIALVLRTKKPGVHQFKITIASDNGGTLIVGVDGKALSPMTGSIRVRPI